MISIIDLNYGNLRSICNFLEDLRIPFNLVSNSEQIDQASMLLLPGVGSLRLLMGKIHNTNILPVLSRKVIIEKTPIVGICLGLQAFMEYSEEGNCAGLGWIRGYTKKLNKNEVIAPVIGWSKLVIEKKDLILKDTKETDSFYFSHSYDVHPEDRNVVLAVSKNSTHCAAVVRKSNIIGFQFHPEKSYDYGAKIFRNIMEIKNVI